MRLAEFPRYPLLFGPSPVHPLDRLTAHLGGARLWAKREDCNSGLAYGGNKTRKLEYIVPDVLAAGADTLVSIGGYQSNHTRQVAAVAAKLGLRAVLVQERWVDWPDAVYDRVGNILLSRVMGAEVRLDPAPFDIGFRDSGRRAMEEVRARGGTPYGIPAGASDHPLGGLGFAGWAEEVATQERELGVFFDTVVVCSVTGSTQAGMIAGFAGQDRPRRVLGIDASATLEKTREQVARLARNTAELIDVGREIRDDEITLLDGWAGERYGVPVASTLEAIRLTGRLEGISSTRCTRGSRWPPSSTSWRPGTSRRTATSSSPISAASRRSTPTARCSPAEPAPPAVGSLDPWGALGHGATADGGRAAYEGPVGQGRSTTRGDASPGAGARQAAATSASGRVWWATVTSPADACRSTAPNASRRCWGVNALLV